MPRAVNSTAAIKRSVNREAENDLRALEIARRHADLFSDAPQQKRPHESANNRVRNVSSSDDSDEGTPAKASRTTRDDVLILGETTSQHEADEDVLVVHQSKSSPNKTRVHFNPGPSEGSNNRQQNGHHSNTMSANMNSQIATTSQKVVEFLDTEINAERQLENESLEGGLSRPSISGFRISTDQAMVRLTKQTENERILVVFNVSCSVAENNDDNPNSAPVPMSLPPFRVEITKNNNKRLCFRMSLEMDKGQYKFRVDEFYVAPAATDPNQEVSEQVYKSSGRYINHDFHDVFFVNYLGARGFNSRFCQELVDFATWYEHECYLKLLGDIKDFAQT